MNHNQTITIPKSSLVNSNLAICFLTSATHSLKHIKQRGKISIHELYEKLNPSFLSLSRFFGKPLYSDS